jgi:hypothetical protein
MSAKGAFGQGRNRSRSGKRNQPKAKAYKLPRIKKIEIESTTDKVGFFLLAKTNSFFFPLEIR